jgi:hypothetical protein
MLTNFFTFSRFTLLVAISISAIAAWYSVIGLTAIFAGAVVPIIIMGTILEIAKITSTVWLHKFWNHAGRAIKIYLTSAVIILAFLTSMGIFGFLSKAHIEQNAVGGDVQAQVSLLDEKIKTQRDNIQLARQALDQMNAQVEQRLSRSDSEQGAERAVQIRRQQSGERIKLQQEIANAQKEIAILNEQRSPLASQLRKVEAEVGPIKYIAALIYGDNPDTNLLEKAVRWVIIVIVLVFDPLAIILILAANSSLKWELKDRQKKIEVAESLPEPTSAIESENVIEKDSESSKKDFDISDHPYLFKTPTHRHPPGVDPVPPQVYSEPENSAPDFSIRKYDTKYVLKQANIDESIFVKANEPDDIETETVEKPKFFEDQEYVHYDGKLTSIKALKEIRPEVVVSDDRKNNIVVNFGNLFPKEAFNDEYFIRVDTIPHKVYKFENKKWTHVDKNESFDYLQSVGYIRYLVSKIESNQYSVDLLTEKEKDEISTFLKTN